MKALNSQKTRDAADDNLARDILDYLGEFPGAMDTLEGIAEWWLMRQRVRVVVEQVERVLMGLTERGELEALGAGPSRRYRLPDRASQPLLKK